MSGNQVALRHNGDDSSEVFASKLIVQAPFTSSKTTDTLRETSGCVSVYLTISRG